jgi:hypothetical protein
VSKRQNLPIPTARIRLEFRDGGELRIHRPLT